MASSYSTNLAIELIGTGDQAGTWGVTTNTNLGTLIEQAISGYVTQAVSTGGDTTITIPNGATGVARNMYIELTGTGGANTNLIVPSNKKLYFVFNNTASGQVTVKVSGQTGVSVPNGAKMILVSNGTDIVDATNYVGNISAASGNITVLTSASATITNLLATSLTVSSGSTLNGGVVVNELGADVDFRVEGDTDANLFFVDASTDRIGVGTNSPATKLDVNGVINVRTNGFSFGRITTNNVSADDGGLTFQTVLAGTFADKMVLNADGNLGVGTSSPSQRIHVEAADPAIYAKATSTGYSTSHFANDSGSSYFGRDNSSGTNFGTANTTAIYTSSAHPITFYTGGGEKARITSGGDFIVGGTSAPLTAANRGNITVNGSSDAIVNLTSGGTSRAWFYATSTNAYLSAASGIPIIFEPGGAERARITSGGDFLLGTAKDAAGGNVYNVASPEGISLKSDYNVQIARSGGTGLFVNRQTNDGTLVSFFRDTAEQGTISVSGGTVSYNAFAGSHWSQLQDGSKPDILRGTVMESINELCEWPGEENERLPKAKISDTAGSKKVYGVFMAWDNDWTETNDMYVTAVGAFICRVNANVTVQEGDLLESNGDGTARVQADDIIRSSTIGKVTSTVKTHEYDDGSYCVPTVLYCG